MAKRAVRRLPKSVRPEEFPLLIAKVPTKNIKHKIGFLLAYGSGMRVSEVVKCKAQDFRENSIEITEGKGGKDRIVPIPKGWRKEFVKYLPLGISKRALQKAFKLYKEKANLNPKYSFHSLRHGFGTRLVENGVPINQVQILMGHSNLATTSVYTMASPVDAIKNYEDLF